MQTELLMEKVNALFEWVDEESEYVDFRAEHKPALARALETKKRCQAKEAVSTEDMLQMFAVLLEECKLWTDIQQNKTNVGLN